jgi:hypothetical protein
VHVAHSRMHILQACPAHIERLAWSGHAIRIQIAGILVIGRADPAELQPAYLLVGHRSGRPAKLNGTF